MTALDMLRTGTLNRSGLLRVVESPAPRGGGKDLGDAGPFAHTEACEEGLNVFETKKGDVIDVVMANSKALNGIEEQHSWHLHGHSFWIMKVGEAPFTEEALKHPAPHPPQKDTVSLLPGHFLWLRFRSDNKGVWPFHCHVLWHHVMGMEVLFVQK
eukprot:CAMPEP_0206282556 /NCGR_PEP_ID=MMETSP0047_2-20121206/39750_1 /ASSEMBLY_ACC=CAM_ASM_000192 /TAXON_ID=195065 /ORGANISM="Chroomonas mesostigmatica_cf, Strain CCMP1168" /LENGTH=155 /DNA_ID=CAMNT_0053712843 /DNA_START=203 /DNA_END=670 /DNA_ORIENTATION=+